MSMRFLKKYVNLVIGTKTKTVIKRKGNNMSDINKTIARANAGDKQAQRELETVMGQQEGYYAQLIASVQETKKAAEAGSVAHMTMLGQIYYTGIGTNKNPLQAEFWLKKAADQNDHAAMYHLGQIYFVEYDDKLHEAKALIEKAMTLGPIPGVTDEEVRAALNNVELLMKYEKMG